MYTPEDLSMAAQATNETVEIEFEENRYTGKDAQKQLRNLPNMHVLLQDCVDFLEFKMKCIAKIAKNGNKVKK